MLSYFSIHGRPPQNTRRKIPVGRRAATRVDAVGLLDIARAEMVVIY